MGGYFLALGKVDESPIPHCEPSNGSGSGSTTSSSSSHRRRPRELTTITFETFCGCKHGKVDRKMCCYGVWKIGISLLVQTPKNSSKRCCFT